MRVIRGIPTVALVVVLLAGACSDTRADTSVGPPNPTVTVTAATTLSPPAPTTTTRVATTTTTTLRAEPALLGDAVTPFEASETFQVAFGDVDGNGHLDAVLANPRNNNATVWLGDGIGGFTDTGQRLTLQGHGVGLADFDGDGDLDAFITCHGIAPASGLPSRLYLNDGNGAFLDAGTNFGDADRSGVEVQVIDVQGDGWPDVYVSYFDPAGEADLVYVNDGTGVLVDSGMRIEEDVVAWGDLDGDGDVDMFGKRIGEAYVVRANDGTGVLADFWSMAEPAADEGAIALADLDQDGDLDALIGNGRDDAAGPAQLLWNNGTGSFTPAGSVLPTLSLADFGVADLDGDGHLDVVVASGPFPDEVWLGDGAGGFTAIEWLPSDGLSTKVSFGDVDEDGDLDVIIGSLAAPARLYVNLSR